jgi:dTDP-4-amino-4,6-dideoxygalactose transaminase
MEGIQGGLLAVKLKYLDHWNNQRRQAAKEYDAALSGTEFEIPTEMPYNRHVYHLYVIQSNNRDILRSQLAEAGIESGLHYPIPLHLQEAYRFLGYKEGDFPVTERVRNRILSLPMYPGIRSEAISQVVSGLKESCYVG